MWPNLLILYVVIGFIVVGLVMSVTNDVYDATPLLIGLIWPIALLLLLGMLVGSWLNGEFKRT